MYVMKIWKLTNVPSTTDLNGVAGDNCLSKMNIDFIDNYQSISGQLNHKYHYSTELGSSYTHPS